MVILRTIRTRLAWLGLFGISLVSTINLQTGVAAAREAIDSSPSAALVTGLFNQIMEVTFPIAPGSSSSAGAYPDNLMGGTSAGGLAASPESQNLTQTYSARVMALRQILSAAVDSDGIAHFILGRYANAARQSQANSNSANRPARSPGDGFLDFAAATVAKLGSATPASSAKPPKRPTLSIFHMTVDHDQVRLVASELALPNGKVLPLTWKVSEQAGTLKIEDVDCLGISLRLMLRSAVAHAAAEHPDEIGNLGQLLGTTAPFGGSFSHDAPTGGTAP